MLDRPLPYGRIIRDAAGQIMDIIEEDGGVAGSARDPRAQRRRLCRECGQPSSPPCDSWLPSPRDGQYRLTDCVHQLIRSGLRVESYQLYDQDEVQGINTAADLAHAEFILQKRLFRPRRQEEQNLVAFGTGGWRAIIGEGFTLHNVRRLCQALANEITRQGQEKRGVIIGYDRRFLSRQAAEAAAEVFAGNNIAAILLERGRPDAADHLRHGDPRIGLRPGLHRQPQPAGMERPQGLPRRRLAAARRRDAADRGRDQRAHRRTT